MSSGLKAKDQKCHIEKDPKSQAFKFILPAGSGPRWELSLIIPTRGNLFLPVQLLFFFYSAERSRYGADVMARNRFTDGLVLSLIIFVR
jgi:hypothetical protein